VLHSADEVDLSGLMYLREEDPYYINTAPPTVAPETSSPTAGSIDTSPPIAAPTLAPTTLPTETPTSNPTAPIDPYPPNIAPLRPESSYFNYDTSKDAKYGPGYTGIIKTAKGLEIGYKNNAWTNVKEPPFPRSTWLEFSDKGYGTWKGVLGNRDPLTNQCGRVGRQSPIDLRESGAKCDEHHEVRSRVRTELLFCLLMSLIIKSHNFIPSHEISPGISESLEIM